MGHRIAGVWHDEPGDFLLGGMWHPDGDEITKYLIARMDTEPFYRAEKLLASLSHVKRFRGAIDCGAWIGAWAREMGKRFERVVAIEMDPGNARCAAKNCDGQRNVVVLNCAVGDHNGTVMSRRTQYGGIIESWAGHPDEPHDAHGTEVEMKRLDDLVNVKVTPHIDFLKVHVNGAELLALRGAEKTIAKHRPVIAVVIKKALENFDHTPEDIQAFMRLAGYKVAGGAKPYWTFVPR